jgi:hypothetical protein
MEAAMSWKHGVIGSLVTMALLGGLAAMSPRWWPAPANAEGMTDHAGWLGHRHRGGGFAHLCQGDHAAMLDAAIAYLERRIDPSEAQAKAFARFTDALRAGAAALAAGCFDTEMPAPHTDAPSGLAATEAMMAAGLEALRTVRPSFDALYAVLDERQREVLNELWHRRGAA